MKTFISFAMLMAILTLAGCGPQASDQFAKLTPGMSQNQVQDALGKPEAVRRVRFSGYEDDYLVWEYNYAGENESWCPTEAVSRLVTGVVTLGFSEIAWNNAKIQPHWVYFVDDRFVFTTKAFDCEKDKICVFVKR